MKLLYFLLVPLLVGCSAMKPPLKDISNAKLAMVKIDNKKTKTYFPKELKKLKYQFKMMQNFMNDKRYKDAKFLAQEIRTDSILLQKKINLKEILKKYKAKEDR